MKIKRTQCHFIQGVLKVLPNVLTVFFLLLCTSPHTSAQHVPTPRQSPSRKRSTNAQAALKLQLHALLSSTVGLQTGTLLLCHCQMVMLVHLMPFP